MICDGNLKEIEKSILSMICFEKKQYLNDKQPSEVQSLKDFNNCSKININQIEDFVKQAIASNNKIDNYKNEKSIVYIILKIFEITSQNIY